MPPDSNQSKSPICVYFLGAGASAIAGVPTFANFREAANIILESISSERAENEPDDRDDQPYSESEYSKTFRRVINYWDKYFKNYDVEQFYAAVEMDELLKESSNEGKLKNITTKDIEKVICRIIQKSLEESPTNANVASCYSKILNIMENTQAVVITTNWDIVLESSDSLSRGSIWKHINYEGVCDYNTPNINIDEVKNEIKNKSYDLLEELIELDKLERNYRILKLHGSLNWGFCESCGQIYYFEKKKYESLSLDEVECHNDICKGKNVTLEAVIVPPTLSKLAKAQPNTAQSQLVKIWNKAKESIEACEKLYFIGYSFPETDVQMRVFISNALRNNHNLKKVTIVSNQKHGNSRVEFEERYLSIFSRFISHSKIEFFYKGFEDFCNEDIF